MLLLLFFLVPILANDDNKWVKITDRCIRPYGFAAPVFCFEYVLPDGEIMMLPQFATTTTITTSTDQSSTIVFESSTTTIKWTGGSTRTTTTIITFGNFYY